MSYGVKEARINQERKPRVNLCGSCGARVSETELLCAACRNEPTPEQTVAWYTLQAALAARSTPLK
jgi:predicted amidophosphoribosyltransferase